MLARLVLAACLAASPAAAQQAPRPLFPTDPPPPAAVTPDAPIGVQDLPAPAAPTAGLASGEVELAGPLWTNGAPPGLATLLQRLPAKIDEPTLRELQRALLAAPGAADVGPDGLLAIRTARLMAMGEAATALELLTATPAGAGPEFAELRLRAGLAAGRTEEPCAAAAVGQGSPWLETALVCAALARDATAVDLAFTRLDDAQVALDPNLAGLARAALAGTRYALQAPVADDALLLPLLRSVPVDLDAPAAAELPVAARQALADNPGLSSATRAAVLLPTGPGPSIRPELTGAAPADWAVAAASVPEAQRARWAALVDGLGQAIPDAVWDHLAAAAAGDPGPPPELALWRGFEQAGLREQRGGVLLFTLLLLEGRPASAAPVTLRRALDALIALGLERDARALAAGTGGALGL